MNRKMIARKSLVVAGLVLAVAVVLSACGGVGGPSAGNCVIKVVSSLPMQGAAKSQTDTMINAIKQALDDHGAKSGNCTIEYAAWDDSSAALGKWDPAVETANANKAVADSQILAYLGTYNSGAAKLSIPILNQAGPLVMVSPANTYPGLTKKAGAEAGEPEKYYPTGKRNYARVVPADDIQGAVGARWYKDLGFKSVYILDDQELYGKGVADIFEAEAKKIGLEVKGHEGIDTKATDYSALATKIANTGVDAVYFGGIESNHPGLVLKALRAAGWKGQYGGPDGMATVAFIQEAGADAEGTIGTFGGLPPKEVAKASPAGQKWYDDYKKRFNSEPENYATYSYETMMVILKAIDRCVAKNTITRACVRDEVFNTKNYEGMLGATWSFDENGDTTLTTMSAQRVQNGEYVFISPLK
jgi:branched-chain amino acid transport system substrate-binding protein